MDYLLSTSRKIPAPRLIDLTKYNFKCIILVSPHLMSRNTKTLHVRRQCTSAEALVLEIFSSRQIVQRAWNRDRRVAENGLDCRVSNSDWGTKIILVSTCSRAHLPFCAVVTTHTGLCQWESHRKEKPIMPLFLVPESRMHSFNFSHPKTRSPLRGCFDTAAPSIPFSLI